MGDENLMVSSDVKSGGGYKNNFWNLYNRVGMEGGYDVCKVNWKSPALIILWISMLVLAILSQFPFYKTSPVFFWGMVVIWGIFGFFIMFKNKDLYIKKIKASLKGGYKKSKFYSYTFYLKRETK